MPTGCAECGEYVPEWLCSWHSADPATVKWDDIDKVFKATLSQSGQIVRVCQGGNMYWFCYCRRCKERGETLHILRAANIVLDRNGSTIYESDSDNPSDREDGIVALRNDGSGPVVSRGGGRPAAASSNSDVSRLARASRSRSRNTRPPMTIRGLERQSEFFSGLTPFRRGGFADVELDRAVWMMRMEALQLQMGSHESLMVCIRIHGYEPESNFRDLVRQAWRLSLISRDERNWLHEIRQARNAAAHVFHR